MTRTLFKNPGLTLSVSEFKGTMPIIAMHAMHIMDFEVSTRQILFAMVTILFIV
jgi:hypothetical protein